MLKTFLLIAVFSLQAAPSAPPEFTIVSDECDVSVADLVRDDVPGVKMSRGMQIAYHVPTSDLAEDRATAFGLGAPMENVLLIDRVVYRGVIKLKSAIVDYASVEFYAGERLVATRRIGSEKDSYQTKATRIYDEALRAYRRKAGR